VHPGRALLLTSLLSLSSGVAAADEHFIDFEEDEWDSGCGAPMSCPGVGYAFGVDERPAIIDVGCIYGRCLSATFHRYDGVNYLVPERDGWVPDRRSVYFEAAVKLDSALDLTELDVTVLELSTESGSAVAKLAFYRGADGSPLTLTFSSYVSGVTYASGCTVNVPAAEDGWHRVRAFLALPTAAGSLGDCTVAANSTDTVVDTLPVPPDLATAGFGGAHVLSSAALPSDVFYPTSVVIDDVCLTENLGSASFCDGQRMDRDPRWMDVVDGGLVPDVGPEAGIPDSGADVGDGTVAPDLPASFRGGGGCMCGAVSGPAGPASSGALSVLIALALFRRRRSSAR